MPREISKTEFDVTTLIGTGESGVEGDDLDRVPAKEEPEAATETDPDDDSDVQEITIDDLNKMIEDGVKKARESESDPDDDEDLTPEQRRIRDLEAENARLREDGEKRAATEREKAVDHEVRSAIGKYKMTREEVSRTVEFFEQNHDLEGVWSFEQGALRVHPELRDRLKPNPVVDDEREGERAEIITRGAGGPGASAPFRPVAKRGDYSSVTEAIRRSPASRKLVG